MKTEIVFTPWFYLQCFLCGVLGVIANILINLRSLKTKAKVANEPFSVAQAIKEDLLSLCLSFVAVLGYLMALREMVTYKPHIAPFIKIISIGFGGLGAWLCELFFGEAKKRILSVIDKKTNIADAVTGDGTGTGK